MKVPRDWGKTFFRSAVFSPGQSEALARAREEAAFVAKVLDLRKGQRLLDVCCGTGRHSLLWAKRGLEVVGLDATEEYLREARRLARGGKNLAFVRGDMRRLPYRGEFDAAVNLWTSFGYFLKPVDDVKALRAIARALRPGGLFLIDVVNAGWLRRHFIPRNWSRRSDGSYLLEDTKFRNGRDPAMTTTWTVLRPGRRPVSASFFVRAYDIARLSRYLRRAGLVPIRRWGDLDGRPYASDSKRLVVLAKLLRVTRS